MINFKLEDLLKKHHEKFLKILILVFITSSAVTLLLAIQLEKTKQCERFSLRFHDINDVLAREIILGSKETLEFELNKLKTEFDLNEINKNKSRDAARTCSLFNLNNKNLFVIRLGENVIHEIVVGFKTPTLLSSHFIILFLPIGLIVVIIFFYLKSLNRIVSLSFIAPLEEILAQTDKPEVEKLKFYYNGTTNEFINLKDRLNEMLARIQEASRDNLLLARSAGLGDLASQVAHDIRSPLASLAMLSSELIEYPENKRQVLRNSINRIQDIANSLLAEYKTIKTGNDEFEITLLSPLIEEIITEKRNLNRHKLGVTIDFCDRPSFLTASSRIQPSLFKRVISNLLENSVEAVGMSGVVGVFVEDNDDEVLITVSDNGKGIPKDILKALGKIKVSDGKDAGTGLGVYSSVQTLQSWGGSIEYSSNLGEGTEAVIKLPRTHVPTWLATEISIGKFSNIVVLDDESTIHQLWKSRIDQLAVDIKLDHFSSTKEAEDFLSSIRNIDSFLFLIDYELIGSNLNGLEFIEKYKLSNNSVLVTSRYEQADILKKCKSLNLKILPKSCTRFVKISNRKTSEIVLIDDDKLIRVSWGIEAEKNAIKFTSFASVDEFLRKSDASFDAEIYIDSDLGNGLKGEILAREISLKGYKNIFLATGYEDIDIPSYIIKATNKSFPR